LPETFWVDWNY